jgi:hypothetical protein
MGLRHFGQMGGGVFLGMTPHAGSGASTELTATDLMPRTKRRQKPLQKVSEVVCSITDSARSCP